MATCLRKTRETNDSGQTLITWQVVESDGKALTVAQTLMAGDVVRVEGTLRRRTYGEGWEPMVGGWALHRIQATAHAAHHGSDDDQFG